MASGSYAKKPVPREIVATQSPIPPRATRQLEEEQVGVGFETEEPETGPLLLTITETLRNTSTKALEVFRPKEPIAMSYHRARVVDEFVPSPLVHHKPWINRWIIGGSIAIIFLLVLISAAAMQRPSDPQLIGFFGGKVYSVQVGGSQALASKISAGVALPPKVNIPANSGPYSVIGKPTLTVDFINRVLASYNSPAAGKGQALYDLGVKYGIDPAFALAFFLHESTMGTAGEARSSLSLGNLRCIPNFQCQDGYAWFPTWESGFEAWYALIRNVYVDYWGRVTVDQIIPKYAPTSDNNNEAAYIASVKHTLDVWHAGVLQP